MILPAESAWQDAVLSAAILAVAPASLGGIVVKAFPGPVRDSWLQSLRELLGKGRPWSKLPLHVSESRLLGGLDLVSTLRSGEPVFSRGLLAESDGGLVLLSMAERADRAIVAQLCAALDQGEVAVERDGFSRRNPANIAVVALDEGLAEDDDVAGSLTDRMAFICDLRALGIADLDADAFAASDVEYARLHWRQVEVDAEAEQQLCAAAAALAIDSLRPASFTLRVARIIAALEGRDRVESEDLAVATRLVLLPRTPLSFAEPEAPAEPESEPAEEQSPETESASDPDHNDDQDEDVEMPGTLDDSIVEAAAALLPPGLLAALGNAKARRRQAAGVGKSGAMRYSGLRGRPIGSLPGNPRQQGRMDLLATLRSAAPWQRLRRNSLDAKDARQGVLVESSDFRIKRYKQRSESTVIFVVDASGSAALHRLAEAKGAVEMLLADCYVRRDRVALIAFRGTEAELLLPPTRSLVRAKRSLTALPGGGGTPLAAGLQAAMELTDAVRRRGGTPTVVVLTDGRANVCLDGQTGRQAAFDDAKHCAAMLRHLGARCMVVDTSVRPHKHGAELAQSMGGNYLPLPHADAGVLSSIIGAQSHVATA